MFWSVIPGWSEKDQTRNLEIPGSRLRRTIVVSIMLMNYYVYILASRKDGAIYVGITSDVVRRIYEHRTKGTKGFTSKHNITRLVWFETYDDPVSAISREKELKKWKRSWKIQLIETENPQWEACTSRSVVDPVIPGWSEGPDLRCAIAHREISRFRVHASRAPE
jgi:putative endonuclease